MAASPAQPPNEADALRLEGLLFKTPDLGRRLRSYDVCVRGRAAKGWVHVPYAKSGNRIAARWCRGVGAASDCRLSQSTDDRRGKYLIEIGSFFIPDQLPEAFGLVVDALEVPQTNGWGAHLDLVVGGEPIAKTDFGLTLSLYDGPVGPPRARVRLGSQHVYRIGEQEYRVGPGLPPLREMSQYFESPKALRHRAIRELEALAGKVRTAIESGEIEICERGSYRGDRRPPVCVPRVLTAAEREREQQRAVAYFREQRQLVQEHAKELHEALQRLFPCR